MQRFIIIILVFIFNCNLINAQSTHYKYDANWVVGYEYFRNNDGTIIHFYPDKVIQDSFRLNASIFQNCATISNKEGNLQFYSNGCTIFNRLHLPMENGDSINFPSDFSDSYCKDNGGNIGIKNMFIIPHPDSPFIYNILHFKWISSDSMYGAPELLWTKIDMSFNNGLGKVIFKNQLLFSNYSATELMRGHNNFVKHGNGRDWWILSNKAFSHIIYTFRFDHERLYPPIVQQVDSYYAYKYNVHDCFSPDGQYYIRPGIRDKIELFGFNRCTGTFTSYQQLDMPKDTLQPFGFCGVAVSQNSQFLYVSTGEKLYQFDIKAANITASRTFIGEWDTVNYDFEPEGFFQMQLAADGKIYICPTSSTRSYHVINQPNEKGLACDFVRRGLRVHSAVFNSVPIFPNYNLDSIDCHISTHDQDSRHIIALYPNPSADYVTISDMPEDALRYELHCINGALCMSGPMSGPSIDIRALPVGIYLITLYARSGKRYMGKVAKME